MVWIADPDDVILAKVAPHLDFNNNNWFFGVIAKRVMRAKRDVDRLARGQCVALETANRKLFVNIDCICLA